jgi:nitrite reductase/ring-hydroxylating ferredoxin subunit
MDKIDVGAVEDFVEGRPHAVRAGNRDLVVVRKGDAVYAVRDACPHQGAKLSDGCVIGDVAVCERGEQPEYVRDGEFLACPWHGWKVDVTTGCSAVEPERVRVRSYDAQVDGKRVYVEMGNG